MLWLRLSLMRLDWLAGADDAISFFVEIISSPFVIRFEVAY